MCLPHQSLAQQSFHPAGYMQRVDPGYIVEARKSRLPVKQPVYTAENILRNGQEHLWERLPVRPDRLEVINACNMKDYTIVRLVRLMMMKQPVGGFLMNFDTSRS